MKKFEPTGEDLDQVVEGRLEKAAIVAREIDSGAQGSFDTYVTINFEDNEGRFVEARLMSTDGKLNLNANIGSAYALVQLKERFEERGVLINRLYKYLASPDEKEVLEMFSK